MSDGEKPNVFSVDLEDWYQGLEVDMDEWGPYAPRIDSGLDVLLELLARADVRATFFVLGWQAERTPAMVPRLAAAGHEIASHGWSHRFVYRQAPAEFRHELRRSIDLLEAQSGQRVVGYRAPFFSITAEALWALDVLVEEGIRYDSSIFPTLNYRYGIAGADRHPGWVRTPSGARLFEIPLSTVRVPHTRATGGLNLPLGGGGYFRLYPYGFTRALVRHLVAKEGRGLVFYVHPWEYDPGQPRVKLPRLVPEITHYLNLASTADKTRRLLEDFRFGTMRQAFAEELGALVMKVYVLTQEDAFYIPRILDTLLASRRDVVGIGLVPGELRSGQVKKYLGLMGPRDFALQVLNLLAHRAMDAASRVISTPHSTSVEGAARRARVRCERVTKVNAPEFLARLRGLGVDLIVSIACPQKLNAELLALPAHGCINLHGALLPRYQGMLPSFWVLAKGERETGVTVHWMSDTIDGGDVLLQETLAIRPDDTMHRLVMRSKVEVGRDLLVRAIERIERGDAPRVPMDPAAAAYFSFPDSKAVAEFRARGRRFI